MRMHVKKTVRLHRQKTNGQIFCIDKMAKRSFDQFCQRNLLIWAYNILFSIAFCSNFNNQYLTNLLLTQSQYF